MPAFSCEDVRMGVIILIMLFLLYRVIILF